MNPDHAPSRLPHAGRLALWLAAWLALTVYLLTPPNAAMTPTLDSSNYGTYAWLTSHGKQHGTDVVAMTGPFGFLAYGTTYTGELVEAHRIGDLLLKGAFSCLALLLAAQAGGFRRWVWLGLLLVFLPNVSDLFYDLAILVAGLWLLSGPSGRRIGPAGILAAGLLGFMGLMKGTHVLVAGLTLGTVLARMLFARRPDRALGVAVTAVIVFLAGWLAVNQKPGHLAAYFRGVWELAGGYNDAMGLESGRRELAVGLGLAAGLASLHVLAAWTARKDAARLLVIALLAGFAFLKWKHGFLRADGHVFIFFNYALLAVAAFWLVAPNAWTGPSRRAALLVSLGVTLLGGVAAGEFRWARFAALFTEAPDILKRNVIWLAAPAEVRAARERELAHNREVADLPQIRAEIEDRTVDFFGYEQGILLLNGFNYHPRPMGGGSFNVFTRYLQRKNEAFVRDPNRRPEFQLVKLQTLDGRLPTADDPLTLNALLHLYVPVRAQRDYLLFRRRAEAPAPSPEAIRTVTARAEESIPVPAATGRELILFSVDAAYSVAGRLRGILYRPPRLEVALDLREPAGTRSFRVAPAMLRVPVLLSPLIESNEDLLGLYGAGEPAPVAHLTVRPEPGFADEFNITFYRLPAPPVPPDDIAGELLTHLRHPLTNRKPLDLATEQTGIRELHGEPITLVHAPGQLVLPLQPRDQQVIFSFGLMPQAYDPGRTKGVEFVVELPDDTGGKASVLFSRYLDPVARSGDRGMQQARVFLPPGPPAGRLRLRTAPGPTGDASWAQSYFTRIQIKSGPVDPRQFSGFSTPPLPPGFDGLAEHDAYGRRVRAFHPPASVSFPVPADTATVAIAAGLQPAAYEGENRSDGIELLATLESPGQSPQPLARWRLDPLHHVKDRGTLLRVLRLPEPRAAGATLVLRADPGPDRDDRWDWAYLQTVHFQ